MIENTCAQHYSLVNGTQRISMMLQIGRWLSVIPTSIYERSVPSGAVSD